MRVIPIVACGLAGCGIVFVSIPLIIKATNFFGFQRARDFHHRPQPSVCRLGGLALVAAFLGVEGLIALIFPEHRAPIPSRWVVILSSLAIFVVGLRDDLRPLAATEKLLWQVVIGAAVWWFGFSIDYLQLPFTNLTVHLEFLSLPATLLWLVGFTNLINLIDGVDGLAGSICLLLMGLLMYIGHQSGTFVLLTAGMLGGLLAFLKFNSHPARIYLGDGGAYFLGFQIGLFSIVGSQKGTVFAALFAPLFLLGLAVLDTSSAILRRSLRGLPVFRPDQDHIHHRLLGQGMSHGKVVLTFCGVGLAFLLFGLAAVWARGQWLPVLLGVALVVALLAVERFGLNGEWFAIARQLGDDLSMRRDVRYAIWFTKWLVQEGERCRTPEELFEDLVFAARRLGFTAVKITLADGSRLWEMPGVCEPQMSADYVPGGGCHGILELKAPSCRVHRPTDRKMTDRLVCTRPCCPAITDSRLFEIMAELLAEAWLQATLSWKRDHIPLRFDTVLTAPPGRERRPKLWRSSDLPKGQL